MKSFLLSVLLALIASIAHAAALVTTKPLVSAPPVTASVYQEAMPMLYASRLVYNFADIVAKAREANIELKLPENFPLKDLSRFRSESIDLREFNDGNGISFAQLNEILMLNSEALTAAFNDENSVYTKSVINDIREYFATSPSDEGVEPESQYFLSTYRSLQNKVACVYGVVKDTQNKRIIVSFRGSKNPFVNQDWQTNFNAKLVEMKTPKKVRDKMKGAVKKRVLVHRGFYEYLFDNKKSLGEQKYDEIINDIQPLMEEGYGIYVTGHSLGGALATMFSFKLAGAGKKRDWVPRPVTCITYAAPFTGTKSYRAAFEQEEQDGWIRSLRVNNGEDLVPSIPTTSLGFGRKRNMKHTGINLRLTKKGMRLTHSSNSGLFNAVRNSLFKPIWSGLTWHGLPLHEERMQNNIKELSSKTLDELYKDKKVVSKSFAKGDVIKEDDK